VKDGQEYANDRLGSMVIVLDNLIFLKKVEPVLAVFIDPRDPQNLQDNRRESEYTVSPSFADFVVKELVPKIDSTYKTIPSQDERCILGTSLGGINSASFRAEKTTAFHLIACQSPAFWYKPGIFRI